MCKNAVLDLTSIYLRAFFGARSFESDELDSLAKTMGVAEHLSSNPKQRYFLLGSKSATAANVGDKIVFGEKYYGRLSKEQRLAVAAHEFAHSTRQNDNLRVASVSLTTSAALSVVTLAYGGSILVAEVAFLASFFPVLGVLTHLYGSRYDDEEMDCDDLAASFASRDALASSILLAREMSIRRFRLRSRRVESTADERVKRLAGNGSIR